MESKIFSTHLTLEVTRFNGVGIDSWDKYSLYILCNIRLLFKCMQRLSNVDAWT